MPGRRASWSPAPAQARRAAVQPIAGWKSAPSCCVGHRGDRLDDCTDRHLFALEKLNLLAVAHHADPIAVGSQFLKLGGDDVERHAVITQLFDQANDLGMRTDVDASRRL